MVCFDWDVANAGRNNGMVTDRCYVFGWTHNRLRSGNVLTIESSTDNGKWPCFMCRKRKWWQNRNNVRIQIRHFEMPKWGNPTNALTSYSALDFCSSFSPEKLINYINSVASQLWKKEDTQPEFCKIHELQFDLIGLVCEFANLSVSNWCTTAIWAKTKVSRHNGAKTVRRCRSSLIFSLCRHRREIAGGRRQGTDIT